MAFGGQLFIATGNQEPLTISEAIVTSDRIFLEWVAQGQVAQLEATSTDGVLFRGEFHAPLDSPAGNCELTLFKSLHESLLFGKWQTPASAQQGIWVFRLQTDVVRPNKSIEPRPARLDTLQPRRESARPAVQVEMTRPSGESLSTRASQQRPATQRTPVITPAPVAPVAVAKPVAPTPVAKPPVPVAAAKTAAPVPPTTMFSNQLDHLSGMTSEEFAASNQADIEAALASAPSSALFKLSRSAAAPELKALASALIERQRSGLEPSPAKPQSDPIVDAKTMRAQQRRSSKHWKG